MRLVVLTNILAPYRIPLFEAMAEKVEDLLVLLMADREENRSWILSPIAFHTQVLPGFHVRPPGRAVSLHINFGLGKVLRTWKPDVVLSGGFTAASVSALIYCRMTGIPYVSWGELVPGKFSSPWSPRGWVRHLTASLSAGAIASSSLAKEAFCSFGILPERVHVSLMPIDVEFFHRNTQEWRVLSSADGMKPAISRPSVLFVGHIIHSKGIKELLDIYECIRPLVPSVSLVLVGEGQDRPFYEELVKKRQWSNVHFEGFIQPDELPRYFAGADVFVFPTLFDRFGAVLSEAMAAGLPVVSSIHAAATRDLVVHGVSGFHIDPRHPEAASRVLLEALQLSDAAKVSMGKAAYERVKQHDCRSAADDMVKFLERLAGCNSESVPVFGR